MPETHRLWSFCPPLPTSHPAQPALNTLPWVKSQTAFCHCGSREFTFSKNFILMETCSIWQKYFNFCRAVKGTQSSPSALLKREETCYRNQPQLANLLPTELGPHCCKSPTNFSEAARPSTTTVFSLADEIKRLRNRSA